MTQCKRHGISWVFRTQRREAGDGWQKDPEYIPHHHHFFSFFFSFFFFLFFAAQRMWKFLGQGYIAVTRATAVTMLESLTHCATKELPECIFSFVYGTLMVPSPVCDGSTQSLLYIWSPSAEDSACLELKSCFNLQGDKRSSYRLTSFLPMTSIPKYTIGCKKQAW